MCVVGIKADVAKGTSLAQEVPALIQFDLDLLEPLPIGFGECPLFVQSVFLSNQALNVREDRLIFVALILHENLSNRGWNRHVTILCYAYPKLRSTDVLATWSHRLRRHSTAGNFAHFHRPHLVYGPGHHERVE